MPKVTNSIYRGSRFKIYKFFCTEVVTPPLIKLEHLPVYPKDSKNKIPRTIIFTNVYKILHCTTILVQ